MNQHDHRDDPQRQAVGDDHAFTDYREKAHTEEGRQDDSDGRCVLRQVENSGGNTRGPCLLKPPIALKEAHEYHAEQQCGPMVPGQVIAKGLQADCTQAINGTAQ